MKREIKFRGQSIRSDKWCYGNLSIYEDECDITGYDIFGEGICDWNDETVDSDTVGQYTGLKDKNGKEIYEGDIVYSEFADGSNCMFLVGWNNKLSCFGVMDEHDYRSKQLGYDFPEFNNPLFIGVLKNSKIFKIIGNIHDNPELLKGGEE